MDFTHGKPSFGAKEKAIYLLGKNGQCGPELGNWFGAAWQGTSYCGQGGLGEQGCSSMRPGGSCGGGKQSIGTLSVAFCNFSHWIGEVAGWLCVSHCNILAATEHHTIGQALVAFSNVISKCGARAGGVEVDALCPGSSRPNVDLCARAA